MKLYNDFIGGDYKNVIHPFTGGDSEEQFNENSENSPSDWYYHNVPIEYSFNELGHRSKNIVDVDLDNYILFTGCSHTAGVGLELEKTYSHILSKTLGVDYYNIAMPATGIDVLEYNLLTWFAKVEKKPKMVIIQLPDHTRYTRAGINRNHLLEGGAWDNSREAVSLIVNGEDSGFFYARKLLFLNLIENIIKCPIYKFTVGGQVPYTNNDMELRTIDRARDLSHPGIISNEFYANKLHQWITDK